MTVVEFFFVIGQTFYSEANNLRYCGRRRSFRRKHTKDSDVCLYRAQLQQHFARMKKLISLTLILYGIHATYAASHSIKYFYTAVTAGIDFPEFTIVGLVDDEQFVYYDSNTRRMVPKTDWMKKNEGKDYWDRESQIILGPQQTFKNNIGIAMQRFNQTQGRRRVQTEARGRSVGVTLGSWEVTLQRDHRGVCTELHGAPRCQPVRLHPLPVSSVKHQEHPAQALLLGRGEPRLSPPATAPTPPPGTFPSSWLESEGRSHGRVLLPATG
ncbi:hypothetical protein COCON_G00126240 [Conger conger]|uniref:MHC class I-like antigen recognition-like domain-containing protein n=1 Tax=Conger conger TaxID=82655 RepID=A0A9Q1DCX3_CONCO|nr:hypothetical protein COCON_G00126240 [Conger conger]